jgi:hypothetical protein
VYLREQSRACVSFYCETVKYGSSNRFAKFAGQERMQRFFDYYARLREWEDAGWTIQPRVYYETDARPDGWDLIDDFEHLVWPDSGAQTDHDGPRPSYRQNRTLPAGAYAVTSYLNYARISPRLRTRLLAAFARVPIFTTWFARSHEPILEAIRARHREGNERVAERYFGRQSLF